MRHQSLSGIEECLQQWRVAKRAMAEESAGRAYHGDSRRIISGFTLHRRWLISAVCLIFLAFATAYAISPRKYDAAADVIVTPSRRDDAGARAFLSSPDAMSAFVMHGIGSPRLIAQTVEALGLASWPQSGGPAGLPDVRRRPAVVASVQDRLRVDEVDHFRLLRIHFAAEDRRLATSTLDDLLLRFVADIREGGRTARGLLRERAVAAAAAMRSRDETLKHAQAELADREAAAEQAHARLADMAARHTAAAAMLAKTEADIISAGVTGSRSAPDSPALRDLIAEQRRVADQIVDLGQHYGPLYPEVIDAQQQLAAISLLVSSEFSRTSAMLAAADAARRHLAALDARTAVVEPPVPADDADQIDLAPLKRDADAARDRLNVLAEQLRRPPLLAPVTVTIAERAHAPLWPSTPNPLIFVPAAIAAALVAAAITWFIRERRQRGFRNVREVERGLNLKVMALVPELAAAAHADDGTARPIDALDTDTDFHDAFDRLIANIGAAPGAVRSVAVCSAMPNEGKTTVSICLARMAARAGSSVVLVDCDGRRRELSRLTATPAGGGLVQLMAGTVSLDAALVADRSSTAWIIPHSSDARVDPELFATSDAVEALLGELLGRFDLVVLDTAPLLALEETRLLARLADGVVLVARWRRTPAAATQIARDILLKARATIAGVALTRVRFA